MIRIVLHSSAPLPSVSFSLSAPFCPGVNPNSDPNPLLNQKLKIVKYWQIFGKNCFFGYGFGFGMLRPTFGIDYRNFSILVSVQISVSVDHNSPGIDSIDFSGIIFTNC
jgi:hypothetical protein